MRPRSKRYPWEPLEPLLKARLEPLMTSPTDGGGCIRSSWRASSVTHTSLERLADLFAVDSAVIYRWQQQGLTPYVADSVAVRLGYMPWEIWPEYLTDGTSPVDALYELDEWWRPAWMHEHGVSV